MAPSSTQAPTPGESSGEAPQTNGAKAVQIGMECDIKNLYSQEDDRGRSTWSDQYPDNLHEAAENEMTARYAILVRNKKSFDARKKLEIDSIVIQSPLLKQVLDKVFKDYRGVTPSLNRFMVSAPFEPFVHRWESFNRAIAEQADGETKQHLQLLHRILHLELKDVLAAREDYIAKKVITFDHLWTIFQPGCTVYSFEWGRDCGAKLKHGNYFEHPKYGPVYTLYIQTLDWDGDKFGYSDGQHLVLSFAGTMPIASLDAFPLDFHPHKKEIEAKLLKRGKLFEHFHGYHYKAYKSFAIGQDMYGRPIKVTVDSRIIIDTFAFKKFNPNRVQGLAALKMKWKADTTSTDDFDSSDGYGTTDEEDGDDNDQETEDIKTGKKHKRIPLTDDNWIHATPLLKGYALKTKQWLEFFVDVISEIHWDAAAFSSLVLPSDQKDLILAFAESQVKYKDKFDDVISGKGKGIILLLSGGPGIGKTLTAESVAENMKVPLYMMSAGDLGVKSSEVEQALTTILEMVAKWNAVLLLDECDVFLEARSAHDLERNKIVSIFLRTLEYYEGILFLTTNRVKNMDPAFQSRIHISIEYSSLDIEARKQVWKNFLARNVTHELSEEEVVKLAAIDINGRQIKNVLKSGELLACHKGTPLRYEHLITVLNVENKHLTVT